MWVISAPAFRQHVANMHGNGDRGNGTAGRPPVTLLHLEDSVDDALLVRRQLERDLPASLVRWVSTESDFKRALARERIQVVLYIREAERVFDLLESR
jgi:hypothetical protein